MTTREGMLLVARLRRLHIDYVERADMGTIFDEAAARIEAQAALIKRMSEALLKVRPLGGSEMFIKFGEEYVADPGYCGNLIEELKTALHEANCRAPRAALEGK